MRRTPLLVAAVSLVAAATPAALLAHPSDGPKGKAPERHHPGKAKAPKAAARGDKAAEAKKPAKAGAKKGSGAEDDEE